MDEIRLQYSIDGSNPVELHLSGSRAIVGSSRQADIHIDSPFLSRQQFVIEVQGGTVYITDLGSSNGTMLNGRTLPPNTRTPWRPGDSLGVANIRFVQQGPATLASNRTVPLAGGSLSLIASPDEIRPGQPSTLTLHYNGDQPQPVYFRAETETDGLEVSLTPSEGFVQPGQSFETTVDVLKRRAYWTGGSFPVTLVALTNSGLDTLTQIMVRVRPRYELLLLLLLLIPAGIVAANLLNDGQPTTQILPTDIPPTDVPTDIPTGAPTDAATATDVPPTEIPSSTPFPTSTLIPTRQPTTPPIIITVIVTQPPVIIFPPPQPPIFIPPPGGGTDGGPNNPPQLSCAGFALTSPFGFIANGVTTFTWNPPTSGGVSLYTLRVTNQENGQSTSASAGGGSTSVSVNTSLNALGQGFNFTWTLTALLQNGQTCSDSSGGQRPFCDGTAYNPCPAAASLPRDDNQIG